MPVFSTAHIALYPDNNARYVQRPFHLFQFFRRRLMLLIFREQPAPALSKKVWLTAPFGQRFQGLGIEIGVDPAVQVEEGIPQHVRVLRARESNGSS
jgi:hypothetical protein